jgi:hypothetical protein
MSRMSENVGASTSRNPKGLHGLYRDKFTFIFTLSCTEIGDSAVGDYTLCPLSNIFEAIK